MSEENDVGNVPAVERVAVEGECPACGAEDLRAYPVMAELGWEDVVKCQQCLHTVSREPGNRLGSIHLLADLL